MIKRNLEGNQDYVVKKYCIRNGWDFGLLLVLLLLFTVCKHGIRVY